jgi:hypothetical protein
MCNWCIYITAHYFTHNGNLTEHLLVILKHVFDLSRDKISGYVVISYSHTSCYEEYHHLACNTVQYGRCSRTIQRSVQPSSVSRSLLSKRLERTKHLVVTFNDTHIYIYIYIYIYGVRSSVVVEALSYKPEGRGIASRWGGFFLICLILPAALWPLGRLSLWQEWVPGILKKKEEEAWG